MTSPFRDAAPSSADGAPHVLDRPAWSSLTGAHAGFAVGDGRARRYRPSFSPFAAVSDPEDEAAWNDLARLLAPGERVVLPGVTGLRHRLPAGWQVAAFIPGVQLIATAAHETLPDGEAFVIGAADAAEAADLAARTEPGPFRPETYRLGTYLGVRREGRLVAMAGERLHPTGWSEISAVCTDPDHRRQGLATRLVRAVGQVVRDRGEQPFLHTMATNVNAIALYLAIGYELRREVEFLLLEPPAAG